ncbi:MAG: anti-anti-sigma factor [Actinomycetia bacterium]|nr:anti-anti-sigma factor [Actinomycetes bacterium]
MNLAHIDFEELPRALIVRVKGEIDLSNVDDIRNEVTARVASNIARVVLDLSATTYLDSSGIRLLFDLAERLQARRQQLALVVTDQALVRRVILLTKLDDEVPLHTTVESALGDLA